MKNLMIDIETMSNTSNAVMIQLAGVYFDPVTGETEGEFWEDFCKSISIDSCIAAGFETNESTVKWWSQQNQDTLKSIIESGEDAQEVMMQFSDFIEPNRKDLKVWSHATFDFVIVQNYLLRFGLEPMPYRGARDIRTLVDLSGIDLQKYDRSKYTHNALDDCKFQIKYCVDAMNLIKGE